MEELGNAISKKNILVFLFLAIIAVAIPVSLKLAQTQTQLKSKAAGLQCSANNGVIYNSGDIDYVQCRACQPDGSWGGTGTDYGPNVGSGEWCACAIAYNPGGAAFAASKGCNIPGQTAPAPAQPAPAPAQPTTQCTPGTPDYANCRSCGGDGNWVTDYGPYANPPSSTWCACAVAKNGQAFATEKGCPGGSQGGIGGTGGAVCTPTDFGPKSNLTQWCTCASQYAGASFKTDPQYSVCSGGGPGVDAALCSNPKFYQGGQLVNGSLVAGQTYDVKITMTNSDPNNPNPPIWQQGQYFLGFPTNGPPRDAGAGDFKVNADDVAKDNIWQVNWPDPKKLRLPLKSNVGPGGSAEFSFQVTPQKAGTHTFYWSMVHENVQWFGGECTPDISVINSQTAAPGAGGQQPGAGGQQPAAGGLKTKCYVLSQDAGAVNGVTSCDNALAKPYTSNGLSVSKPLQNKTDKAENTFYVKFISTTGVQSRVFSKKITYSTTGGGGGTTPTISNVDCRQNLITITGTNFGNQRGSGKVTANSQSTRVTAWSATSITAATSQSLDGDVSVQVTSGDNQTVSSQCTVNTTTVSFTALNSCRRPGDDFSTSDVEVKIYDATSTEAEPQPLVEQTISLNKSGKPANFAPKLLQGKLYTLIVKAPNTLPQAKTFTPTGGTYNLQTLTLPAGDLLPLSLPAGEKSQINAFDATEMKREWSLVTDVTKAADLNKDGRVNSIDYSCLLANYKRDGDVFTPATEPAANPPVATSPAITTITPANALISTPVTITGVNFGANTGTVNFYAAGASSPTATAGINSWTNTQINATIPGALAPSTQYSVEIVTSAGVKSAKTNYLVGP